MLRSGQYGFSLVEMIIVGAIVGILAVVAVFLYAGYTREARQDVAENLAASAASFVGSVSNMDETQLDNLDEMPTSGRRWSVTLPSGAPSHFVCPQNATIDIDKPNSRLRAVVDQRPSQWYKYDNK